MKRGIKCKERALVLPLLGSEWPSEDVEQEAVGGVK